MSAADSLSAEDQEFLAQCEEELKDRFTDNDENYMKVLNADPSVPPIVPSWWVPNSSRRNDRRNNRRNNPYDRHGNSNDRYQRDDRYDYRDRRGYNDYGDRSRGYRQQRPRY